MTIDELARQAEQILDEVERAKFSPHMIETSMKDDAIEALAGLRAELEHDRTEAA